MTAKPLRLPEPDNSMLARAQRIHAGIAAIRLHAMEADRDQLQQACREIEMLVLDLLTDERRRAGAVG